MKLGWQGESFREEWLLEAGRIRKVTHIVFQANILEGMSFKAGELWHV